MALPKEQSKMGVRGKADKVHYTYRMLCALSTGIWFSLQNLSKWGLIRQVRSLFFLWGGVLLSWFSHFKVSVESFPWGFLWRNRKEHCIIILKKFLCNSRILVGNCLHCSCSLIPWMTKLHCKPAFILLHWHLQLEGALETTDSTVILSRVSVG